MQKHRPLLTSLRFPVIDFHMIPWVQSYTYMIPVLGFDFWLLVISFLLLLFNLSLVTSCISSLPIRGGDLIPFICSCNLYYCCHTVHFSCLNLMFLFWLFKKSLSADFIYLYFFIYFISWRLIALQYCSGFCHTLTWISHGFTCVPIPIPPFCLPPHPSGSSQCTIPEHLSHASNLGWWSVSPLIVYLF